MTPDDFYNALLALAPLAAIQRAMLRAHYEAPNHTATATQIANGAGHADWTTANLHYGIFCYNLANQMNQQALAENFGLILAEGEPAPGPDCDLALVMPPAALIS